MKKAIVAALSWMEKIKDSTQWRWETLTTQLQRTRQSQARRQSKSHLSNG